MSIIHKNIEILINTKYSKEELNTKCGVYILSFNDKHYVGSCKFLKSKSYRDGFYYRLYIHIRDLINNKHHSIKLQRAFNKYGIEKLQFDILQDCKPELTLDIEQYWINVLDSYRQGYNSCPTAKSNAGYSHSEETKLNMSLSRKGNVPWNKNLKGVYKTSEETKLKLSIATKGIKKLCMSEEQKQKISNTLKGRKINNEQRKNYLKAKELQKGVNHWSAKKVYQYDLEGNFIKEWQYIKEVEKDNIKYKQVYSCLNNHQKTASGFRWFYEFLGNKIHSLVIRKNQFNKNLLTLS